MNELDERHEQDELSDVELKETPPAAAVGEPPPARSRWPWVAAALAVLLIVVAVALWWFFLRRPAAPPPPPAPLPAVEAPVPAAPEPEPPLVLPPLDASDALVARLVGGLSAHPQLVRWLANDELVRRFVATVDNVAEGVSPRPHLRFLDPGGELVVQPRPQRAPTLDPASYRRYDLVAAVFASLDSAATARLYRDLAPLTAQAYRELGYPDRDFDRTLARAISRLLAVPVVDGPVELAPKVRSYAYADPALENLDPAQKQLLRMGPENVRRIQAKLRELAAALELAL